MYVWSFCCPFYLVLCFTPFLNHVAYLAIHPISHIPHVSGLHFIEPLIIWHSLPPPGFLRRMSHMIDVKTLRFGHGLDIQSSNLLRPTSIVMQLVIES